MSELERQLHLLDGEIQSSCMGNFSKEDLKRRAMQQLEMLRQIRRDVSGLSAGLRYVIGPGDAA